jgi:uncharacterized Zn finger protein
MKLENDGRKINMLCPTCGSTFFKYEMGVDETIEVAKCASCGRAFTKDELLAENSENIHMHAKEIAKEATSEITQELKKSFKNIFANNKNIRIK